MAKDDAKRGVRWGRLFFTLIFLGALAAGTYGASWLNARRYYLIVDANEVRVAKGRMLPMGHEPFVPREADLRAAYEKFPLPSGINIPRGETTFTERDELNQAIFRLLKDTIAFTLSRDDRASTELVSRYLVQIRAVPGTNVSQQIELEQLERDAAYSAARHKLDSAIVALKEAARLFKSSSRGAGARRTDGEDKARRIESAIGGLEAVDPILNEAGNPVDSGTRLDGAQTRSTTTATRPSGP